MHREVKGKYTNAVIHAVDDLDIAVDQYALAQVQMLCDCEACDGAKIRIMPDVHAGKIGPIGLTLSYADGAPDPTDSRICESSLSIQKIMPGLLGNDIGCGVSYVCFKPKKQLDFARLDKFIRSEIAPRNRSVTDEEVADIFSKVDLHLTNSNSFVKPFNRSGHLQQTFISSGHFDAERAASTYATLGGGNHFLEVGRGLDGLYWLFVHSGSRNLGNQIYEYYMNKGYGELKNRGIEVPYELTWLDGHLRDCYLEDSEYACCFAALSRYSIINSIFKHMKWKPYKSTGGLNESVRSCPHNFIQDGIIRKGAISAKAGEDVVVPINMRDGVVLGKGRGNPDWNYSAPHGSGRLIKRSEVANSHTVSEFKKEMNGVWSSCINKETLDEAPFAYRRFEQIKEVLNETVEVIDVVKPLYSFKGQGGGK